VRTLALLVLPLALAACESNYARSARIAREGRRLIAGTGHFTVGPRSRDVRVGRAVVVHGGGTLAAVVELRNTGKRARAGVPLLIDVRDAHGKSIYRNDLQGLQAALQHAALVPAHGRAWWVNDQLLGATGKAKRVRVQVGRGHALARPPRVRLRGVGYRTDSNGTYLTGTIVNRTRRLLRDVPVYAVALKHGRVAAAGRALVAKAPPTGKPGRFRVIFVGNPKGAHVEITVAP
jgi:hypothetical protein